MERYDIRQGEWRAEKAEAGDFVLYADAQATVEALQAQIRALTQQLDAEREKDAAQTLLAEHRRAVRVVKQEIEAVKNDQRTYHSEEKCLILGSLETVLNGLNNKGGSEYVGLGACVIQL